MANTCSSRLIITGAEEDIAAFEERAKGGDRVIDPYQLLPPPEGLRGVDREMWIRQHWGCYSILLDIKVEKTEDGLREYHFWTKWTPALGFFEGVAAMFPTLRFHFEFYGEFAEFAGEAFFADGKVEQFTDLTEEYKQEYEKAIEELMKEE